MDAIFLPALWLFAIYINDALAAALGWSGCRRILYLTGYCKPPTSAASASEFRPLPHAALLGALGAILWRLVHG